MHSILVTDLCKSLGDFALDHVSFQVPQGRIVGVIGENGAGKSTTINLILNELNPDAGKVEILGKSSYQYTARNDVGVVFDECNFHDVFTAKMVGKMLSGVYSSWDDKLYHHYLKRFEIPEKQPIGSFSKGMKMKLSIVCALAHSPKLLILDEATSSIDTRTEIRIQKAFAKMMQGRTSFIVAHRLSTIQEADVILVMKDGKIIEQGKHEELLAKKGFYANLYESQFVNTSTEAEG